ncbi:prephenate dehydrogenase [Metabacillus sp. RGM 3146]|uniref:prephenate dehydrogenase n=1 Tax=Metabacillus sp. RGM 3146 TaxID=3401092 RepID=UPI003B9B5FCD
MHKRIFIAGLGLIGGSIALAIKKIHKDCLIIGYDILPEQAETAKRLGVVDKTASSIEEGAKDADFIFLSAPVEQSLKIIDRLAAAPLLEKVIITDAGSTKRKITEYARKTLPKETTFIGGHPMAGSHKSGVTAAKAHLFENAFYILTPESGENQENIELLKKLLEGTKAQFVEMQPEEHDRVTGVISHFPHIVAASLVHQAEYYENDFPLIKPLAAGGFRDITRIASSNPAMWRDILLQNREYMMKLFEDWMAEMNRIKSYVEDENEDEIYTYFEKAKAFRDGLPAKKEGAIPSFHDLYADVPDYPGVISEVTGYLAKEKISITNIRIIETREEIYGVLRISFQTEKDREKAKICLEKYTDYETFFG